MSATGARRRLALVDGEGSVLLLVLFACLAVAVAMQTLSVVSVIAVRGLEDETQGRSRIAERDTGLAGMRSSTADAWGPTDWVRVGDDTPTVEARAAEVDGVSDWVLKVMVRNDPALASIGETALVERGRDGIDLPIAAAVAATVVGAPGRATPWLCVDSGGGATDGRGVGGGGSVAYLCEPFDSGFAGEGCLVAEATTPWRLDAGWRRLVAGDDPGTGWGPGVAQVMGEAGELVRLPAIAEGHDADHPALVVVTGGADLDARDAGDLYAVIVVDGGRVLLDGTAIHGAVFVTQELVVGESGCVAYSAAILRWAVDRSLHRTRLLPGSRTETTG